MIKKQFRARSSAARSAWRHPTKIARCTRSRAVLWGKRFVAPNKGAESARSEHRNDITRVDSGPSARAGAWLRWCCPSGTRFCRCASWSPTRTQVSPAGFSPPRLTRRSVCAFRLYPPFRSLLARVCQQTDAPAHRSEPASERAQMARQCCDRIRALHS